MNFKTKTTFRTHTCDELRIENANEKVCLSGFVHKIRDHGGLLFIDLRDHYGITQCILQVNSSAFQIANKLKDESVVSVCGNVQKRSQETINPNMHTGNIEILVETITIHSEPTSPLPMNVNNDATFPEETRLTYRYLDLRKTKMHNNIILRSQVISHIRQEMTRLGFLEIQTPILTSSSPEGARDYLVPSRLHQGMFYALPQAPQQFKQLLMVAGFDKYFQIAPCFRDEDARADRSPGEFYQLDMEMSFASQEDIFEVIEDVLSTTFSKFAQSDYATTNIPFPRITYHDAMLHYGTDKPDLRNPLIIEDLTELFAKSQFASFKNSKVIRSINVPDCATKPRSFFEKINNWAIEIGLPGAGYISMLSENEFKGPIVKFLSPEELNEIAKINKMTAGDSVFFVANDNAAKIAGLLRTKLATSLDLISNKEYKFCWIVDFPMFELGEDGKSIIFSHNPFSMPQGGLDALLNMNPLDIKAFQYDIVCNGTELSSGAIRNHVPEIMYRAFEIAGHGQDVVDNKFKALIKALKFGAPPHGGCAPGIDRIVMLLAQTDNIREVIAFPFSQQAQDLMMGAPAIVLPNQIKDLHLSLPVKKNNN